MVGWQRNLAVRHYGVKVGTDLRHYVPGVSAPGFSRKGLREWWPREIVSRLHLQDGFHDPHEAIEKPVTAIARVDRPGGCGHRRKYQQH